MERLLFSFFLIGGLIIGCGPKIKISNIDEKFSVGKVTGKEFALDTNKSVINWIGSKVTGKHNGTIKIKSGSVFVEKKMITGGKFVIDMESISVLDLQGPTKEKLEKHLKTNDFFETGKFPEAVFELYSVAKKAGNVYVVKGNLTIRGITHGIIFDADIFFVGDNPTEAKANISFDRQKWGVVFKGRADDLIANAVQIALDLKIKQ